jgi:hypothetical protein
VPRDAAHAREKVTDDDRLIVPHAIRRDVRLSTREGFLDELSDFVRRHDRVVGGEAA